MRPDRVAPQPLASERLEFARDRFPEATPESLEQGRQTLVASCNKCHGYPDLAQYADARWPKIIERMGAKAKLTPEESTRVLQFVLTARSEGATEENTAAVQP